MATLPMDNGERSRSKVDNIWIREGSSDSSRLLRNRCQSSFEKAPAPAKDPPVTPRYGQSRRFANIRARVSGTFLDRQHNQARNGRHTDAG
jgi:hypothetical protein